MALFFTMPMDLNVKQLIFISFIFLCTTLQAKTFYVSPDASGNGSDWSNACNLATACQLAVAGDDIWVAKGTHTLPGSDRTTSFQLASGVHIYGGFAGNETILQARQIQQNPTILSADIGQINFEKDNAYTILSIQNGDGIIVDGFIFTGGMARDYTENLQPSTCGAAIYINSGSPQIVNCTFVDNLAQNGGAVYINGQFGYSSPFFNNCIFRNNKANFGGGAVYNNGQNGKANPIFQACIFEDNKSDYGACLFNNGSNGESAPLMLSCKMFNNFALATGALIYTLIEGYGTAKPILENCDISENGSVLGENIASNRNVAFLEQSNNPTGSKRTPSN